MFQCYLNTGTDICIGWIQFRDMLLSVGDQDMRNMICCHFIALSETRPLAHTRLILVSSDTKSLSFTPDCFPPSHSVSIFTDKMSLRMSEVNIDDWDFWLSGLHLIKFLDSPSDVIFIPYHQLSDGTV